MVSVGGVGFWMSIPANTQQLTLESVLNSLDNLQSASVQTTGQWKLSQILQHCAQSVEYSITGFPIHKSMLFKHSVGKLAFAAFEAKGKMSHALDEVIPGAPDLKTQSLSDAFDRFRQSIYDFDVYNEKLQPHFAYGSLSKLEYEKAHVMHFFNHMQEISIS